jgi:hypothetical protein
MPKSRVTRKTIYATTEELNGLKVLLDRLESRKTNLLEQRKSINTQLRRNTEAITILKHILEA